MKHDQLTKRNADQQLEYFSNNGFYALICEFGRLKYLSFIVTPFSVGLLYSTLNAHFYLPFASSCT